MELISNIPNEILFVGAIYKHPDYLVEYGHYVKSKYDFADEATKFFYDAALIIYETRTQEFNKTSVLTFMAEDESRLSQYKRLKGWSTIEYYMSLANDDDIKGYFNILKKYSLLREYQRNGFNIEGILKHRQFEMFGAQDIYKLIRGKADKINTVIITNDDAEILNNGLLPMVNERLSVPDMGLPFQYSIMNDLFRGLKLGTVMFNGMPSNAGKTRYMMAIVAYVTLVQKQKALLLLNEMDLESVRYCLLVTAINNPEFQELHGHRFHKDEREITLGMYRDANGNFIFRKQNEDGEYIESIDEFTARVYEESEEYRNVLDVCQWIESESQGLIIAKDVSADYSDKSLRFEIQKAALTQGVKYVFYDTLKNDIASIGEWAAFKVTATELEEIAKNLKIFIYGSIQLAENAHEYLPDELNSNNIAESKMIKHVAWTMVLFKEIPKDKFAKYQYISHDPEWGGDCAHRLNPDKRYYVGNIDKNRFGEKKKIMFEVNLNQSTNFISNWNCDSICQLIKANLEFLLRLIRYPIVSKNLVHIRFVITEDGFGDGDYRTVILVFFTFILHGNELF